MTERPTSEVLNLAADLIEERGWVSGSDGWGISGPYCALGAIGCAAQVRRLGAYFRPEAIVELDAATAVADHLSVVLGDEGEGVYEWNDADGRTATEVIEVLRATALIESAREREAAEVQA